MRSMVCSKHLLSTSAPSLPPPSNPPNPLRRTAAPPFRLHFSPSSPLLAVALRSSCGRLRLGSSSGDGNAESRFKFRDGGGEEEDEWDSSRSEKRRWWSEDSAKEADNDFDGFDDPLEQPNPWEVIWIFKVFKSYGYLLPVIIASMLLATGPKAFLMALALPLGQSAISLAIDKVWGKIQGAPQAKPKNQKQKSARPNWGYKRRWQDRSAYDDQERNGYESWATDASVGNNAKASGTGLGGWDELDRQGGKTNGFRQSPPPRGTPSSSSRSSNLSKKEKLSKRGKYKDVPLFLRLLIAAFPFLASWTRILW